MVLLKPRNHNHVQNYFYYTEERIMTDPKYESFNTLPDQEEPDLEHWNTEAMRKSGFLFLLTIAFMRAGASRILLSLFITPGAQCVLNKYFLNG